MTIAGTMLPPEPIWSLDRRESGHLFLRREASRVKFRCEVEVLEYIKDPAENDSLILVNGDLSPFKNHMNHHLIISATFFAAIAVSVILPWFLIGGSS
ncbi:hypothetical protein PVAND_001164 [Polypedilum vanderplanki]|uniref:Uncharacterized protein n=1 Tax=Polypedilum vanderplanki TaxID=319348 RepID=A0A9J6BMP7_POLVA|nr:hypothetical protein PVAND_001164 [Polypedilum vanderplanki]